MLKTTDVLWTKPSELVFYSALGIPYYGIGGRLEVYNRTWLKTINAGISQNNPKYTHRGCLIGWKGWLAEAAIVALYDGRQFRGEKYYGCGKGVKEPAKLSVDEEVKLAGVGFEPTTN